MTPNYGINIADLTKLTRVERLFLVGPVLDSDCIVQVERNKIDGWCAVFQCDEARSLAIIQILRNRYPSKNTMRLYKGARRLP